MQYNTVKINESLTAGIDLDMVMSEYEAIEKVNEISSPKWPIMCRVGR